MQTMFGGSVRKGTYVTGLSDIDALLMVNQSSLVNQPPARAMEYVRDTIKSRLRQNTVGAGNLAVTGQLLRRDRDTDTARHTDEHWRHSDCRTRKHHVEQRGAPREIRREARQSQCVEGRQSSSGNQTCQGDGGLLHQPSQQKDQRLPHGSLAIDAFEDYQGPFDPKSMLTHLLGYSMEAVKNPIVDSTGQSRHVDEYLGQAGSNLRKRASTQFGQMRADVRRCKAKADFNKLFCEGNR